MRYIEIYKNLEDVYDQMLHPQKRRDLKSILESCLGRLIEIKHAIVVFIN